MIQRSAIVNCTTYSIVNHSFVNPISRTATTSNDSLYRQSVRINQYS